MIVIGSKKRPQQREKTPTVAMMKSKQTEQQQQYSEQASPTNVNNQTPSVSPGEHDEQQNIQKLVSKVHERSDSIPSFKNNEQSIVSQAGQPSLSNKNDHTETQAKDDKFLQINRSTLMNERRPSDHEKKMSPIGDKNLRILSKETDVQIQQNVRGSSKAQVFSNPSRDFHTYYKKSFNGRYEASRSLPRGEKETYQLGQESQRLQRHVRLPSTTPELSTNDADKKESKSNSRGKYRRSRLPKQNFYQTSRNQKSQQNTSRESHTNFVSQSKQLTKKYEGKQSYMQKTTSSIGAPVASKGLKNSQQQSYMVGSKFPQRNMAPQRQSLLLTKQSSISGGYQTTIQQLQNKLHHTNQKSTDQGNNFDINCVDSDQASPLQISKKNLEQNSIKSGKYDTLKAMNISEQSKPLEDGNLKHVIQNPQVKMLPVMRNFSKELLPSSKGGENFKSTLSNQSFRHILSSSRPGEVSSSRPGEALFPGGEPAVVGNSHSRQSSDDQLNKWNSTNPFSSKKMSNEIAISDQNQKMLEIKGSDGDKIMVLQFDSKQLQVFNDILEKQIAQAKLDSQRLESGERTKIIAQDQQSSPKILSETEEMVASFNGCSIFNSTTDKALQQEQGVTQRELQKMSKPEATEKPVIGFSRGDQALKSFEELQKTTKNDNSRSFNAPGNLNYSGFESPKDLARKVFDITNMHERQNYRSNMTFSPTSQHSSQSGSRLSRSRCSKNRTKKPVDLTEFIKSWHEESRISSPGCAERNKFYLDAAKYSHHKRDSMQHHQRDIKTAEANKSSLHNSRPLFSRENETTLCAPGLLSSDFEKSRAFSGSTDAKGIPVKEFRVDIRKPKKNSKPQNVYRVQSQETFSKPLREESAKAHNRGGTQNTSQSFLQFLTKRFGPNLVSEYLMNKNLASMRQLIRLEQSQHCQCLYQQQLFALQKYQELKMQKAQKQSQELTEFLQSDISHARPSPSVESGIPTQTSPRDKNGSRTSMPQARFAKRDDKTTVLIQDETTQSAQRPTSGSDALFTEPVLSAQPCKNCMTQSNFTDLLCKVYQRQVEQKLQPVVASNQITPRIFNQLGRQQVLATQKTGPLHHTRYFKRAQADKQIRELKKQTMLRKARNSKVLNVMPMQNLKSFDKHVQRCLTVKNDSVLHSHEMKRGGQEMGLIFPSVLSSEGLSNSALSIIDHSQEVKRESNATGQDARDGSSFQVNQLDTSSSRSASPAPMLLLNPKQDDQQNYKDSKVNQAKLRSKKSSTRFNISKGRNYSTLTRNQDQPNNSSMNNYQSQQVANLGDQLNRVLGGTKGSHIVRGSHVYRKFVQKENLIQSDEGDSAQAKSTQYGKRTSVMTTSGPAAVASKEHQMVATSPINDDYIASDQPQPSQTELQVNQLKMAAAMRGLGLRLNTQSAKAGKSKQFTFSRQADSNVPSPPIKQEPNSPLRNETQLPHLQSIGASTYLLTSERRGNEDLSPQSAIKKEIGSVLETNFDYNRKGLTHKLSDAVHHSRQLHALHSKTSTQAQQEDEKREFKSSFYAKKRAPSEQNAILASGLTRDKIVSPTMKLAFGEISPKDSSVLFFGSQRESDRQIPAITDPNSFREQHQMQDYQRRSTRQTLEGQSSPDNPEYTGKVNFSASKHVPKELAKFFRYARKSALKHSFDMRNAPLSFLTTQDFHGKSSKSSKSNLANRRGLKTSENQSRPQREKSRGKFVQVPKPKPQPSNTRYCLTRQRSRQTAQSLLEQVGCGSPRQNTASSSSTILKQLLNEARQENQKAAVIYIGNSSHPELKPYATRNLNAITNSSQLVVARVPSSNSGGGLTVHKNSQEAFSCELTRLGTQSRVSMQSKDDVSLYATNPLAPTNKVEFKALKPTILNPASALSPKSPNSKNVKLIVNQDFLGMQGAKNGRCVRVNPHKIVVKDQPRQISQIMSPHQVINPAKQEKFLLTDPTAGFFR